MTRTISAMQARQNLGDVLNRVSLKRDEFIIERGGKPMAAVIPVEKLEQLREAARRHLGVLLEKSWSAPSRPSAAEADRLGDEAKRWARRKRRASR